jgi:DNA helicase-2/ATP-dependent DNA helicase PcrA
VAAFYAEMKNTCTARRALFVCVISGDRVLVVLDDAESTHFQFSYEKYLGLKGLSDKDREHIAAGEETTVDRTRRLFYVSCTRALRDLAVVLFTADPERAEAHVRQLNLFEDGAIHTNAVFEGM